MNWLAEEWIHDGTIIECVLYLFMPFLFVIKSIYMDKTENTSHI